MLGIYAQRFDASGNPVGSEFRVNTTTVDHQNQPQIAELTDGSFVVTWHSWSQDGSGLGIIGQRFAADGSTIGAEFQINTYASDHQMTPQISALDDGGFVVVWHSASQDGDGSQGIYGQRFDASGGAVGGEFRVNTTFADTQDYAEVTGLPDGGFVVSWSSNLQDGSGYGIFAQRYDQDGNTVGGEFQVNSYTSADQFQGAIAGLEDGGVVFTWVSDQQDGSGYGIYGALYSPRRAIPHSTYD